MDFANNVIIKYFPNLSETQKEQFSQLEYLYNEWNTKINVISRKDIGDLYVKHVLHALAIAKVIAFKDGTKILDVGTGGGLPGIPLAILFPKCEFVLIDAIGKKIKVVNNIITTLELKNVRAYHKRAEEVKERFHFVVTRAVTSINKFLPWLKGNFMQDTKNNFKSGVFFLKGGDLNQEILESNKKVQVFPIANFFAEDFFTTKFVLYTRIKN